MNIARPWVILFAYMAEFMQSDAGVSTGGCKMRWLEDWMYEQSVLYS